MADCTSATGHKYFMSEKLLCSRLDTLHVSEHEYTCNNADNDEYEPE